MKFAIQTTTRFNKDFKRCKKRGYPMQKLMDVVALWSKTSRFLRIVSLIN